MKETKIVACLGYRLGPGGQMDTILKNRLNAVVDLVEKNPDSIVILMGRSTFLQSGEASEANAMEGYLMDNFSDRLRGVQIIKEEKTTSAVEQICVLRGLTRTESAKYKDADLTIVSSEVFSNRIKMYVEYIFGSAEKVNFVASPVPSESREDFLAIEQKKLLETKEWLSKKVKGDYRSILKDQKDFEEKLKRVI